ncbi:MAG: ATP-binding cassette domain-containing protein, partial [Pseudomonadota bacterium]
NRSVLATLFHRQTAGDAAKITELLELVKLSAERHRFAADLSHGQKQWLEIGMLLAQDPELLLVDEPAAGMTDAETMRTAELLRDIASQHTVIVVEHDMEFVRALDCKVTVLHQGAVLAEGSIDHVSANPEVIEVYLGR